MRDLKELKIRSYGNSRPYAPPTKELIGEFQLRFGVKLPPEYAEFLKFKNGGSPTMDRLSVGGTTYAVNDFYGLANSEPPQDVWDEGNLWFETRLWREAVLGSSDVPIARDSGGGQFYLSCTDRNAPVHFIRRESGTSIQLSRSFEAFIDGLSERPKRRA